jgi:surfeit locus 1 family protein
VSLKTLNSRFWLITVAAIVSAAITMKLGFWQLSRAQEKLALQASIQAQAELPSLDAAALVRSSSATPQQDLKAHSTASVSSVLHRNITLIGRWLPQHTLFLDNRQMDSKPGLFVLTPFEFTDNATLLKKTILVQRGWLPRNFLDRNALPKVLTEAAEVTITGRIAPSPSKLFEFKGVESGALRQNIELEALAKELKLELLPYSLLQLDMVNADVVDNKPQTPQQDKLQRRWAQPNYGSEKNYGYMVQWWALSTLITLLYVWFQLVRPNLKAKK